MPVGRALEAIGSGRYRVHPVLDAAGRSIGLATRADALRWLAEGVDGDALLGDRVSDVSMPVMHPDDVASHAIDTMLSPGGGRFSVVDPATGRLVGIVTRHDLLQVRAGVVKGESERSRPFGWKRSAVAG